MQNSVIVSVGLIVAGLATVCLGQASILSRQSEVRWTHSYYSGPPPVGNGYVTDTTSSAFDQEGLWNGGAEQTSSTAPGLITGQLRTNASRTTASGFPDLWTELSTFDVTFRLNGSTKLRLSQTVDNREAPPSHCY